MPQKEIDKYFDIELETSKGNVLAINGDLKSNGGIKTIDETVWKSEKSEKPVQNGAVNEAYISERL